MNKTILELNDIVKTFPGVLALNGINFNLRSGEVHAICGENGAGKSTLMKVVCGVHKPDSGEMTVNGKKESFANPMEAYSKGVSIIFQETSLFEEMTILDNLFLGHEVTKKIGPLSIIDYAAMEKQAKEIFKRLNTEIDLGAQIKTLGMAQKQMVEIAKALTFNANIIIFDEPTASLTEREVTALFKIINSLKAEGLGIVYISHRMEEIFQICDRVTVVRDGQYISTKNIKETNKDELVADMVGRKMGAYYPKAETPIGEEFFRVEHYYDEGFLEDINFGLRKGEILGFAGLAGAGRTELMTSICGFTPKAMGKVILEGKEIEIKNYKDAMANGIVYVSEDRGKYGLIVDMSIEQNITLPQIHKFADKMGIIKTEKETEIGNAYIKEIGIKAPDSEFMVANLSGGNQQKVAVSKALALQPKILILDEPTRGVDVNAKAEIHKIISDLTLKGLTIIMISSELPELIGMCDRICVMKDGYIAGSFEREEVTQEKILALALESKKQNVVGV
ncbi:D-xylose ABC transporter ATP-binding protein [Sporanaerobium hydrogeniformans]|uniref:D-xylose ABC transporter ATP-binding protein n=1 Tax=Sporanaerobium hydrogeniformans TaxID=3072179 RepID=A0AC61DB86_9FIRM|nr:sugar ABC transporter ATP-binding protein [Sporanaerobium hydrogeniformans]PHV70302.1 D-xylose ABC transporter ATP-binding protein [Sporanaerobium hydrogeniformans]